MLSDEQRRLLRRLKDALIEAFPNKHALEEMLFFEMGKSLDTIAGGNNLSEITFSLIKAAQAQGWLSDLVHAALASNSGNRNLQTVAMDFFASEVIPDNQNNLDNIKVIQLIQQFIKIINYLTPSLEESITFEKQHTTPELQQKLQEYTRRIELLKSLDFQLFFTADDYIKLGQAFHFEYRYEDALASYDKAITIQPDAYVAWFGRGKALKELQRNEEAIFSYDKAIEIKVDYYVAWVNKGGSLKRLQRYEEAIFCCDKAIKIKPDYSRAWYNRACYYALQGKGNIDLANKNLKQAIKLSSGTYRERAKIDPDFDAIRENEHFKKMINE
ncbi:hypothetical protein WA1_13030 [Scytonema hofmannii PCC 7110]|uniref:Effector-associated domain-containing protein n=1 Tax=Scytonema hofmannii PCC 7110 TaxID=128403 RepID=A0A139XE91_9CYAN|nr:effector-associated domain EAD1-containing protein [Scytonema hofmannii]KYC43021.1 hypothetical protein WA1_13030 [Scytonema hofmannii PCC 7110]